MNLPADRPYADAEAVAGEPIEVANSVEAVQDGGIFIELLNEPQQMLRKRHWLNRQIVLSLYS